MLDGIKGSIGSLPTVPSLDQVQKTQRTEKPGGFAQAFEQALHEVDKLQRDADKKIEGMVTKSSPVTSHEAMIALEKADIAFQLMTTIKSKIVRAYEEVIRTQV